MIPDGWRQVADGRGDEVVLAIDFKSGRPEPGFGDLARVLKVPFGMVEPVPPAVDPSAGVGERYLDEWERLIRASGLRVRGVMGYCAGGALACALAARLGAGGDRPAVVLFDPDEVSGAMIFYQFMLAVQQFNEFSDPDELSDAIDRARAICDDPALPLVADRLPAEYREIATRAFAEMGLEDDENVADLVMRFGQFVHYLLASWEAGYGTADASTLAIMSDGYGAPPGLGATVLRVPAKHAEFLSSPDVAASAAELLMR
jgi:hypothetical protein